MFLQVFFFFSLFCHFHSFGWFFLCAIYLFVFGPFIQKFVEILFVAKMFILFLYSLYPLNVLNKYTHTYVMDICVFLICFSVFFFFFLFFVWSQTVLTGFINLKAVLVCFFFIFYFCFLSSIILMSAIMRVYM